MNSFQPEGSKRSLGNMQPFQSQMDRAKAQRTKGKGKRQKKKIDKGKAGQSYNSWPSRTPSPKIYWIR